MKTSLTTTDYFGHLKRNPKRFVKFNIDSQECLTENALFHKHENKQ